MNSQEPSFLEIEASLARLKPYLQRTALISNPRLNELFGAELFLKMENQQITNSFKARGAFNAVLAYKEKFGVFPEKIVAQSTGNHAQAVAHVGKKLGIPVLVYMAKTASPYKIKATQDLAAEVIICEKRAEANLRAQKKAEEGYFFIHPSDNDDVILGQATCAIEALEEVENVEAVFAACGGGGLLSGCYLAKKFLGSKAKIFGCEPEIANDAARSFSLGKIVGFEDSPMTIADGVRTLKVAPRCFYYLQLLDGFLEITEERISYWQKVLSEILRQKIETTAALPAAGLELYLQRFREIAGSKRFVLIISGGNLE